MTIQKPMRFNPKTLSAFSNLANIWAWLNLAVAIIYLLSQIFMLQTQFERMQEFYFDFDRVSFDRNFPWWYGTNLVSEVVLGKLLAIFSHAVNLIGNFFLFKSISIALNVLLEIGFTMTPNQESQGVENE
jgi:hypothetical protein